MSSLRKRPPAYAALRAQFRRFTVKKHYTALVHGRVDAPGRLDASLTHQTRSPCKMAVVRNPDKIPSSDQFAALTEWTPIQTENDFSLLDVVIYTGVTHQIRCHLAAAGHPIAGDTLYDAPALPLVSGLPSPVSSRHWLHASRIILTHPDTAKSLDLACPLPSDWPQIW